MSDCEFCEKGTPYEDENKVSNLYIEVTENGELVIDVSTKQGYGTYMMKINFCPMCGRKLTNKEFNDKE